MQAERALAGNGLSAGRLIEPLAGNRPFALVVGYAGGLVRVY
jgi:hypothetical protein